MITVDFEKRGSLGLCDFLCESIRAQILSKKLRSGERLPSKRSLAEHLNISVVTVQNAYSRLISEGYISSVEKRGYFVSEPGSEIYRESPRVEQVWSMEEKEREREKYFADFTSNTACMERFPFTQWTKILRRILSSEKSRRIPRIDVHGAWELRCAIANYLAGFRNMDVSPDQIVIGSGSESMYSMIVQFLGTDGIYAVENPGYRTAAEIFSLCGAKCVPASIDSFGMRTDVLEKINARVIHVSPLHHFPTGTVMPYQRRRELLSWAGEKKDRIIIEDDYDSEFRFNGNPIPTLQSGDKNGRVIYINTFSKTLSPSLRISYMVLPKNLVRAFDRRMGFFSCPVSAFEQYALGEFISGGYFEKHIIRMKNFYRNLRNEFVRSLLDSRLSEIASIEESDSGLHFLLRVKSSCPRAELKRRLLMEGIKMQGLEEFYYTPAPHKKDEQVFVVNYSSLQKDKIREIVEVLESVFFSKNTSLQPM